MASNTEIVAQGFAAIARGDLEALLTICHEDVEWRPLLAHAVGQETYHGHAGMRQWWAGVQEIFPEVDNRVDDVVEHGDFMYVEGRIGAAGAPGVLQPVAWVIQLRDSKVARMEVFTNRRDARAAARLDQ